MCGLIYEAQACETLWIFATKSLISNQFLLPLRFSLVLQFLCELVSPSFLTFCQVFPSFLLYPVSRSYFPSSHFILSSILKKKERDGKCQQKAVESYCAGGRQHVEDQTMLTRYSMNALSLSVSLLLPLLSVLFIHGISLSFSSSPPPPLFFFSISAQPCMTFVYPAWIPLQPSKPYQPKQQHQ